MDCPRSKVIGVALLILAAFTTVECQLRAVERPSDVTTTIGDEVDFKCRISGASGLHLLVQWAKDKNMLGYIRSIPYDDRISMFGEVSRGEYHLRIKNVSLADDGHYQCQVVHTGQVILANATLNVQVPPRRVRIAGSESGSVMELMEKRKETFTCRSEDGKPAGELKWFRNGRQITDGVVLSEEASSSNAKLRNRVATLQWTPTPKDHRSLFVCRSQHPAVAPTNSTKLSTNFTMHVKYAPSPPEIRGLPRGALLARIPLTLICVVNGGNPPPDVYWYRNGRPIDSDFSMDPHEGVVTKNEYRFAPAESDNGAEYRCNTTNSALDRPLTAAVTLQVHYPPSKVKITGPKNARLGSTLPLKCTAGPSQPAAEIKWVVGGKVMVASSTVIPLDDNKGFKTVSNLTINVSTSTTHDISVLCRATNRHISYADESSKADDHTIEIQFPPSAPSIIGYKDGDILREGAFQSIACISSGGKPPAKLAWYRGSRKVAANESLIGSTMKSELKLKIGRKDNRVQYICKARSPALDQPLSANITFDVYFAPKSVRISASSGSSKRLIATSDGKERKSELRCEVSSANPSPTVVWLRNGEQLPGQISHNKTGSHRGWSITSRLGWALTADDDGVRILCRAEHPGWPNSITNTTTLNVYYAPIFPEQNRKQIVSVVENASLTLDGTAVGKPNQITYRWLWNGVPLNVTTAQLHLPSVTRARAGVYACHATNSIGRSNLTVNVTVKYPASVVRVSGVQVVEPNSKVVLQCQVDGFPIGARDITWRRNDRKISDSTASFNPVTRVSQLTVYPKDRSDSGDYFCIVDNHIGSGSDTENGKSTASRMAAVVLVKQPPVVDTSAKYKKAAADRNTTATLHCVVTAAPEPQFTWSSAKGPQRFQNSLKYHLSTQKLDELGKYQGTLRIHKIRATDFDAYICFASNHLGRVNHTVRLVKSGVPDFPTDVVVSNISSTSMRLRWNPGFDGGAPQRFFISYRAVGGQAGHTIVDVMPLDATEYTLSDLSPATTYLVRVRASNEHGRSKDSPSAELAQTLGADGEVTSAAVSDDDEWLQMLIWIGVAVAIVLVLINLCIVCFCVRSSKKKKIKAREARKLQPKSALTTYATTTKNGKNGKHYPVKKDEHSPSRANTEDTTTDDEEDQAARRRVLSTGGGTGTGTAVLMYGGGRDHHDSQHFDTNTQHTGSSLPPSQCPAEYLDKDDDGSIRTVIEIDADGNQILVEKPSPGAYHTYLVDNPNLIRPPPYEDGVPTNAAYAEALRSNSLQRRIALGNYAPIPYPEPPSTVYDNESSMLLPSYGAAAVVPPMGPLRSLNHQLDSYQPPIAQNSRYTPTPSNYGSWHHQSPVPSAGRNGLLRTRFSPDTSSPIGPTPSIFATTPANNNTPTITRQPQAPPPPTPVSRSEGTIGSQTILSTFGASPNNNGSLGGGGSPIRLNRPNGHYGGQSPPRHQQLQHMDDENVVGDLV